jgi:predicted GTPase
MAVFKKGVYRIHNHIRDSFANVKKDTSNLYEWVDYLQQRIHAQEQLLVDQHQFISSLHAQLAQSLSLQDVHNVINNHYALRQLTYVQHRVESLHHRLGALAQLHDNHKSTFADVQKRMDELAATTQRRGNALKEKVVKNVMRNSKVYIKNAIVGFAEKYRQISGLQLKELVVDEQRLCSKSTFYRLLKELEHEGKLNARGDGQKMYVCSSFL